MSDNELDAELLALAGGDESSSEDEAPRSPPKREPSEPKKSVEKSPPRRGVAQKLKSRAKARRRRENSEDEDDFGISDAESSPARAASIPGSPGDIDDDAPLYPIEGKFRSDADRAEIMSMTEIEREEILAERAAEAQRRAQDQQLKRLLQARKAGDDADGKKRKADTAELDDGQRKSSRPKTKATDKIEAYKRQRELKGAARARGEERRRDRRSPSAGEGYSDRDADGESDEVQFDEATRAPPASKDDTPPELRHFEGARLGRTAFAKLLYYPPFEPLARGAYVRVNIGMDSTGPKYRVGQIKSFRQARPYILEGENGKQVYTNLYIVCTHGRKEKDYPFAACSDSRFSEVEFADFKSTLSDDNMRFPTKAQVIAKCEDLQALRNHSFTNEDIQAKIDKAHAMREVYRNSIKERTLRRRDEAQRRGDDAVVARCNRELAEMEGGGFPTTATKTGSPVKKEDQQARLAQLNKQNRKANAEEVRKALIAEKVAQQKARAAAAAKHKAEEEKKAAEAAAAAAANSLKVPGGGDDLFGEGSDVSRAGTPVNGVKNGSRAGTPVNALKPKKSYGQFTKRKMDDEVIASMDLGIDIDI